MRKRQILFSASLSVAALVIAGFSSPARATSYASLVTFASDGHGGTNVTFTLNEAASDVKITHGSSSFDASNLASGSHTVDVTGASFSAGDIVVSTSDGAGYLTQTGGDPVHGYNGAFDEIGSLTTFSGGVNLRGVAVDNNPADATFGRTYASVGESGIYVMNSDLSFPLGNVAINGGLKFDTASASSPYRINVGADGNLYVSDYSTGVPGGTGSLYRLTQSVSSGLTNGINEFVGAGIVAEDANGNSELSPGENHADITSKAYVTDTNGNIQIYALDGSYGSAPYYNTGTVGNFYQLYNWNVGNTTVGPTTPYAGTPTPVTTPNPLINVTDGLTGDMAMGGPEGNQFYLIQDRGAGNTTKTPDLIVLTPGGGSVEWDDLTQTEKLSGNAAGGPNGGSVDGDLLNLRSDYVSADNRFLFLLDIGNNTDVLPLLAGVPDLNLRRVVPATATTNNGRDITADAAGNFILASSGLGGIEEAGPGGSSTAVTAIGSTSANNTFTTAGQFILGTNSHNISDTTNWAIGGSNVSYLPNGTDQTAVFTSAAAPVTASLDSNANITLGAITFASANGYTISNGGGSLTMNGFGVNFFNNAGANTIAAPVTVSTDVGFYANASTSLTISGAMTYTTNVSAVKNGAGAVTVSNLNLQQGDTQDPTSGNLDIYQGKLGLTPNAGPAVVTALTIASGASLDLNNNDLILNYVSNAYTESLFPATTANNNSAYGDPIGFVRSLVTSGAITSSVAGIATGKGLAVAEDDSTYFPEGQTYSSGAGPFSTYDGIGVDTSAGSDGSGTVIVKYTYYGDLNFDGKVDSADALLMGSYGTSGTTVQQLGWVAGDLNYDGVVNSDDWSLFFLGAAAYNANGAINQVPEPASLAILGLAAVPLLRRRRKM